MIGCFLRTSATAFASIAETVTPLGFKSAYRASKLSVTISLKAIESEEEREREREN